MSSTGKRIKRKSPQTEANLTELYGTPEGETPSSRSRRRERRKKARQAFKARSQQERPSQQGLSGEMKEETDSQMESEICNVTRTLAFTAVSVDNFEDDLASASSVLSLAHEDIDELDAPLLQECQSRLRERAGLCNHVNYIESGLHGKFIVGGRHMLPDRDIICHYCKALKWNRETPKCCCIGGAIELAPYTPPPTEITDLIADQAFRNNIRAYNSAFAFTSMGAEAGPLGLDTSLANSRSGVYTFRVQGQICHRIGTLLPQEGHQPAFAQIYVFDTNEEQQTNRRMTLFSDLERSSISKITTVLRQNNPFVQSFLMAAEYAQRTEPFRLAIHDKVPNIDIRRYNRPTASDVAIIMTDNEEAQHRDIVLHKREGGLLRIKEYLPVYDPLQYPLLFPYGDYGWSLDAKYREGIKRHGNTKLSPREYVAYRLYERADEYSWIHRTGRLLQQFIVDQYAKVEIQRLQWHRHHQKDIRADLYCGVRDATVTDSSITLQELGKRIILPPSFTGGERYMRQQYQDSMAIVRQFGKPDLFITITCNPKWPEISKVLLPHQKADDRVDLVGRVFKLKLKSILEDITKKSVLGVVVAKVHVIEFQKRGLPHAHVLLILADEDKPRSPQDYDLFVSAEIPDSSTQPLLYSTICKNMVHGPCGRLDSKAPCMKDGVCSKGYPKRFCDQTKNDGNGYPEYRRINNGKQIRVKGILLDNRNIVPYNPYLSHKYNCHINVEVCSTIASVKYLYKYVYKGHDRAMVTISSNEDRDEIEEYLNGRYISASESCWRIFEFSLQDKSHTVVQLPVHLPHGQMVTFHANELPSEILARSQHTKLTKFFNLCMVDEDAAGLVYHDVPLHYVWQSNQWKRRKRNGDKAIGRMMSCSPMDIERYHLRLLLCYRRGPKSFTDLKTVDGVPYTTFKEAAFAAGLLEDDEEWHHCLEEASNYQMPLQLRQLFALILCYCQPSDVRGLWDIHLAIMSEDFIHNFSADHVVDHTNRIIQYQVLNDINSTLTSNSKSLQDYPTLPQLHEYADVAGEATTREENLLLHYETSYNQAELQNIKALHNSLNQEQKQIFDAVINAVQDSDSNKRYFFIDGPGGTGKSFLLAQILASIRLEGGIALAVASSGIASLLLMGGRTAHSRFKLPLELTESSTCSITKQSATAKLLQKARTIIWDEAPMMHRYSFEAVDRTLQDLMRNNKPFGGKVMVLSGDFRQVLPVIPRANDAQIVAACLKRSPLWPYFQSLRLTQNMRVQTAPEPMVAEEISAFSEFLLKIGEGRQDGCSICGQESVRLTQDVLIQGESKLNRLIEVVYKDVDIMFQQPDYFANRVVLTPKNVEVSKINDLVNARLGGEVKEYLSIDSISDDDQTHRYFYPNEFLNSLSLSGMPPHRLSLKIGAPIILLRNLQGEKGLCNGTRLTVHGLTRNCIEAKIITGSQKGTHVFIPRIKLISQNGILPFQLIRRQFPVQLGYALTINKAQGQSIHHLGLYLPQPVFTHGQLYVALSRVTSRRTIKIAVEEHVIVHQDECCTRNIVFKEIFSR